MNDPKPLTLAQRRGPYFIIGTVMWEFFSYFGMKALLILYLTQNLLFTDKSAFNLYGAYISLIFVTPIIGGYLADRYLGFKNSIIIGSILIVLGHFCLGFPGSTSMYMGLSLLVVGIGFFKTNAICMIGQYFAKDPARRSSVYAMYYVGANIGGTLGPFVCALLAHYYGWHVGFACAGVGMAVGLTTLMLGRQYLEGIGEAPTRQTLLMVATFWVPGIVLILVLVDSVLRYDLAGYLLTCVGVIAFLIASSVYKKCDKPTQRSLWWILVLALFGMGFWAFDQQGGSSVSLFILRDIDKLLPLSLGHWHAVLHVPTAMFQSLSNLSVIIFGPFVAFAWMFLAKRNIVPRASFKLCIGLLILTVGFMLMFLGARIAAHSGQAPMGWVVSGLVLIGVAEMFVDPVVLAKISQDAPMHSQGMLTGMYYLFVGAFANYGSAQIAKLSAFSAVVKGVSGAEHAALGYMHTFGYVAVAGIVMIAILLMLGLAIRR
jgi:POT family proton-dependent oligopeptide transporter